MILKQSAPSNGSPINMINSGTGSGLQSCIMLDCLTNKLREIGQFRML